MAKELTAKERLCSKAGNIQYKKWLEDPITKLVIEALEDEVEIKQVPTRAITDTVTAAALFHQKVGTDRARQIITSITTVVVTEEPAADYAGTTGVQ